MLSTPTLVVYGNCQAEWVSLTLRMLPAVADRFDVHYVYSFVDPFNGPASVDSEVLARCALLLEQRGAWARFPWREALPATADIVTFPVLTMNALWPLTTFTDPRNVPEFPDYPYGRFPYGDRLISDWLAEGLPPDVTWRRYQSWPLRTTEDLSRVLEIETARLEFADEDCDVRMVDDVVGRFREERLFWTCNHPRPALLARVIERILDRVGLAAPHTPAVVREYLEDRQPNANIQVPIHPDVAGELGLAWYRPDLRYCCYDLVDASYDEYWHAYIWR